MRSIAAMSQHNAQPHTLARRLLIARRKPSIFPSKIYTTNSSSLTDSGSLVSLLPCKLRVLVFDGQLTADSNWSSNTVATRDVGNVNAIRIGTSPTSVYQSYHLSITCVRQLKKLIVDEPLTKISSR